MILCSEDCTADDFSPDAVDGCRGAAPAGLSFRGSSHVVAWVFRAETGPMVMGNGPDGLNPLPRINSPPPS